MRPAKTVLIALGMSTLGLSGAGLAAFIPTAAMAQASDPAAAQVDTLDRALLDAMKHGKGTTAQARYARLAPVVQRVFDFSRMIRFAVGPAWSKMSRADQDTLTAAFARYSIATYAHNFDAYSGQKFVLDRVDTHLPDKLVRTELTSPGGGAPVILSYRMQQSPSGGWRIIDVYFNGSISELAQQSADFASTVSAGGAPALAKKLNDQSDRLLHS